METTLNLTYSADECKTKFKNLNTYSDISQLLQIKDQTLIYYLYRINDSGKYVQFEIPKRSGDTRVISSPIKGLKIIQQKLNYVLQNVYDTKNSAYGFIKDKSIVNNATQHLRSSKNILCLDIEDFFGSINFGRVRGLFMAHPYNLPSNVSTVLAQICCYQNKLPQGSPTSPTVSNMICAKMDDELKHFASINKCIYTRYADDITFSTRQFKFPSSMVNYDNPITVCGIQLHDIIKNNGFKINIKKFRIKKKNDRQEITGVVVNRFLNVKREFIKEIRSMIHAWQKYGLENAQKVYLEKFNKHINASFKNTYKFENVLKGKIEFLGMVRGNQNYLYVKYLKELRDLNPELVKKPLDDLDRLYDNFKALKVIKNYQKRGIELEKLFNSLIPLFNLKVTEAFIRNEGSEQIDGAFKFDSWHYLVECKWKNKVSSTTDIDHLDSKVNRSGKQTMGFFVSIKGWSQSVLEVLKLNPHKQTILMNGDDLEAILKRDVDFIPFMEAKIECLNQKTRPHLGWKEYLKLSSQNK
jgi:RNA-directed DNA polymerase